MILSTTTVKESLEIFAKWIPNSNAEKFINDHILKFITSHEEIRDLLKKIVIEMDSHKDLSESCQKLLKQIREIL